MCDIFSFLKYLFNVFDSIAPVVFEGFSRFFDDIKTISENKFILSGAGPSIFVLSDTFANAKIIEQKIKEKGYAVDNIDSVIILQKPALAPHILEMRKNIAQILSTDLDQISVKATTTDTLGYIGKGEGIAATAVVLISNGS